MINHVIRCCGLNKKQSCILIAVSRLYVKEFTTVCEGWRCIVCVDLDVNWQIVM